MNGRPDRYRLQVRLDIVREEWTGPPSSTDDGYWRPCQDRLNVSEDLNLGSLDFSGMLGVLANLHTAVQGIVVAPAEIPA